MTENPAAVMGDVQAPEGRPANQTRRVTGLLAALRPDLKRFALSLCHDPSAAEEIVQESLLRAWRGARNLRDVSAVKAWLFAITRREFLRRRAREKPQPVSLEDLTEAEAQGLVIENELPLDELRKALLALDSAYREPLVMQVVLGLTTQEIARRLGLTQTAVLTRLFRARDQLRAQFFGEERKVRGRSPVRDTATHVSSWKLARAHRTML